MEDTDKASEEYGYAAYNVTTVKPTTEHPFQWKIDPDDLERIGGMDALRDSVLNQMSVTHMAAKRIAECGTDTTSAVNALNPTKRFCQDNILNPLTDYPRTWNGFSISMGALHVLDDLDVEIPPCQEIVNDDGSRAVVYPGYCRTVCNKANAPFGQLYSEIEDYLIRLSTAHPEAKKEISGVSFALNDLVSSLKTAPDDRDGSISTSRNALELAFRETVTAIGQYQTLVPGDLPSQIDSRRLSNARKRKSAKRRLKRQADTALNPDALTQEAMASLITNSVLTAHRIRLIRERQYGMTPKRLSAICGIMTRDRLAKLEERHFDENHRMPDYYYHTKLRIDADFIAERNDFLRRWKEAHEDIVAHFLKWRYENPHALVKEFKYNYYKAHNGQVKDLDSHAEVERLCKRTSDQRALAANRVMNLADKKNNRNAADEDAQDFDYGPQNNEQSPDES